MRNIKTSLTLFYIICIYEIWHGSLLCALLQFDMVIYHVHYCDLTWIFIMCIIAIWHGSLSCALMKFDMVLYHVH